MPRAAKGCIVFAHANGFPAGTYRVLFQRWRQAGYQVLAPDKFGHDPRFAVSNNWPQLRDQLIHFIDSECAAPVHLVGHSLGG
ncbi:MAG: alpha/beta hydrolase [Rubrivivax sp.]